MRARAGLAAEAATAPVPKASSAGWRHTEDDARDSAWEGPVRSPRRRGRAWLRAPERVRGAGLGRGACLRLPGRRVVQHPPLSAPAESRVAVL